MRVGKRNREENGKEGRWGGGESEGKRGRGEGRRVVVEVKIGGGRRGEEDGKRREENRMRRGKG